MKCVPPTAHTASPTMWTENFEPPICVSTTTGNGSFSLAPRLEMSSTRHIGSRNYYRLCAIQSAIGFWVSEARKCCLRFPNQTGKQSRLKYRRYQMSIATLPSHFCGSLKVCLYAFPFIQTTVHCQKANLLPEKAQTTADLRKVVEPTSYKWAAQNTSTQACPRFALSMDWMKEPSYSWCTPYLT